MGGSAAIVGVVGNELAAISVDRSRILHTRKGNPMPSRNDATDGIRSDVMDFDPIVFCQEYQKVVLRRMPRNGYDGLTGLDLNGQHRRRAEHTVAQLRVRRNYRCERPAG